ncbi:carboxymuconolactone decarboxylase family protein [Methanoplanus limicola]|uniref:Carboxymuconolactone decarboxylase n=1 Tax=Methanoplanus limicola DSM 2279 TaxID=937775 RepID=H1YZF7_9EURY|nr:carboxymuconolactone decarboxylase family protein [Methanoplanus limicola]EHQ36066.1 Carboxymuconolactone decarboxylase [Methanoplanus limicola DSM 2279]
MEPEKYQKGMKVLRTMGDPDGKMVAESLKTIEELAPGLSVSVVEFCYGDIYSRDGLDLKSREIASISALAVVGSKPQLMDHIFTGMVTGLTKREIQEILVQITVFAGFPAALNALQTAREAFELWDANAAGKQE